MLPLTSIEMCAGAGGQALGLERAGFHHRALIEIDEKFAATLKLNRPDWSIALKDLRDWAAKDTWVFKDQDIDLLSGGLPCPPFSIAGKQLGSKDERNLFPAALKAVAVIRPKAVLLENVRGFLGENFKRYRDHLRRQFQKLDYVVDWRLVIASDFGVPQLRPRVAIIAYRNDISNCVSWPEWPAISPQTVGQTLLDLMRAEGWKGASAWAKRANQIAPTIVGGSTKHGGPDLGPTRAKKAWAELSVDGMGIANEPPSRNVKITNPKLTVRMVARLQGFPDHWQFSGGKTSQYRQVGNAFPPPVAEALGREIRSTLEARSRRDLQVA